MCFVMIDEAKRRSLLLFSLKVGFFVLFCFFFAFDFWSTFALQRRIKSLGEIAIRSNNRERSIRAHYSLSYRCRCCCPGVLLSSSFNLKDAFFDDIRSANVNLAKGENSVKSETLPRDERKTKKQRKVAEEDASFSPFSGVCVVVCIRLRSSVFFLRRERRRR